MISIKTEHEIEIMRKAGRITAGARAVAGDMVKPGVTTAEIDKAVHDYILSQGATPSFLGYGGFPGSACISINDVVIHGIPGEQVIQEGDIVSVDVGAYWGGFHGDCCATFIAGETDELSKKLVRVTRESFFEGIKFAKRGFRVSDISHAVQEYVEANGFSVVRSFVGHGVGEKLHEEPEVPNFGRPGRGPRLIPGMVIAVEPMVNAGDSLPTASRKSSPSPRGQSMSISKSDIVLSAAGRDQGRIFFVLDTDGVYATIADGKIRKVEHPKRKKLKHLRLAGRSDSCVAEKIRQGDAVLNSELRKALAIYGQEYNSQNQGGE